MNEKSPRRGPLDLTAEQLDYQDSKARSENKRVRNRLHLNNQTLKGHENTNVSSLDYEMRRLKHELRGIKQTSGYFVLDKETGEESMKLRHRNKRRISKAKSRRQSVSRTTESIPELRKATPGYHNSSQTVSLPVLSTISSAGSDSSYKNKKSQELRTQENVTDALDIPVLTLDSTSCNNDEATTSSEVKSNLKTSNCDTKDIKETFKNGNDSLLGINVEAARNRVQNRLGTEGSFQVDDTGDLTPYMHVPPDGLPRTAYLLPPLQDLLCEAKKARYIRKLRKRNTILEKDDPERELNIDEIFNRNSR